MEALLCLPARQLQGQEEEHDEVHALSPPEVTSGAESAGEVSNERLKSAFDYGCGRSEQPVMVAGTAARVGPGSLSLPSQPASPTHSHDCGWSNLRLPQLRQLLVHLSSKLMARRIS